jgi:hypothetical protein
MQFSVEPHWNVVADDAAHRRWADASGDSLSAHFLASAPDIGASLEDLPALRRIHRTALAGVGAGLVELDVVDAQGLSAIRTIAKLPQKPRGMIYLGSLTVPFRDLSFVIKVQCFERGVTGMRDAMVFAMLAPPLCADGKPKGWAADPYDPDHRGPAMRNQADDERWDPKFPEHPLSRVRRALAHGLATLRWSDEVVSLPKFIGPGTAGA